MLAKRRVIIGLAVVAAAIVGFFWPHASPSARVKGSPESIESSPEWPASISRGEPQPDTPLRVSAANDIRVAVRDRVTNLPIPGAVLSDSASPSLQFVADSDGVLTLTNSWLADWKRSRTGRVISAPPRGPSPASRLAAVPVTVDDLVIEAAGERVLLVRLYASLIVSLVGRETPLPPRGEASTEDDEEPPVVIRATILPPIWEDSARPSAHLDNLRRDRLSSPWLYIRQLPNHKQPSPFCATARADFGSETRMLIPESGDVYLSVFASGFVPYGKIVPVVQGAEFRMIVTLRASTTIRGRVLDRIGEGVAGVRVTVSCRSVFGLDEVIPRADREPGGPGFVVLSDVGSSQSTAFAIQTGTTDADGQYSIAVPYTDAVAAWVTERSNGKGYVERAVGDRDTPIDGLDIVLGDPQVTPVTVQVFLPTGEPCRDSVLTVTESNPPHPFQRQYDDLVTDTNGLCDVWLLDETRTYTVLAPHGAGSNATFQPGKDQVIRFGQ